MTHYEVHRINFQRGDWVGARGGGERGSRAKKKGHMRIGLNCFQPGVKNTAS